MKKSLIALAVLAGVAGTANADTTLYGRVQANYSIYDEYYVDQSYPDHKNDISEDKWISKVDVTAKLGVKGHEDLGNSLKAIYKFEVGKSGSDIKLNTAWVGFEGDSWGAIKFGTLGTAIDEYAGWWGLTVNATDHVYLADEVAGGALWGGEENTVRYETPKYNGFQALASITLDGKGITSGECAKETDMSDGKKVPSYCAVTNRNHNDLWSVGASYEHESGFQAILAYANKVDVAHMVTTSIGYGNDQFSVGVNADYAEEFAYKKKGAGVEILDDGTEQWSVSLNGLYNITKMDSIRAAIGTSGTVDDEDELSEDNPYFVGLSYMHKFSKRTSFRAGYTFKDQNVDGGDDEATTSHKLKLSVRHNF